MVNRWKARQGTRQQTRPGGGQRDAARQHPPPAPVGARPPRRCPNCGGTHADRKCPTPAVFLGDRACWNCGAKGHTSAQCPKKAIKAIEDGPLEAQDIAKGFFIIDEGGFQPVPRHRSARARPVPIQNTPGNYISKTQWKVLGDVTETNTHGTDGKDANADTHTNGSRVPPVSRLTRFIDRNPQTCLVAAAPTAIQSWRKSAGPLEASGHVPVFM